MTIAISEAVVIQNPVMGATTLFTFARAYFDARNQERGPTLPDAMLVLPMAFHRRTAEAIHRMKSSSGLGKALMDAPELPAGLQERVEGYSRVSLTSLDTAVAAGILCVDADYPWPRYTPTRRTLPAAAVSSSLDVKTILAAAKRLGWWFANEDSDAVYSLLGVRF